MPVCVACMEDYPADELAQLPCQHTYSAPCLGSLFENALAHPPSFPPRCYAPIPIIAARPYLDVDSIKRYLEMKAEFDTKDKTLARESEDGDGGHVPLTTNTDTNATHRRAVGHLRPVAGPAGAQAVPSAYDAHHLELLRNQKRRREMIRRKLPNYTYPVASATSYSGEQVQPAVPKSAAADFLGLSFPPSPSPSPPTTTNNTRRTRKLPRERGPDHFAALPIVTETQAENPAQLDAIVRPIRQRLRRGVAGHPYVGPLANDHRSTLSRPVVKGSNANGGTTVGNALDNGDVNADADADACPAISRLRPRPSTRH
ncbi:uncharacterized protein BDV17DRAFT_286593 [Aspergillus undulatus]|uniref:uncharacterized protein n=1 Tax=Aspergillus undulatus TaxID=1810928 RepID=UPI003CCE3C01